jgi:hypothetical protein
VTARNCVSPFAFAAILPASANTREWSTGVATTTVKKASFRQANDPSTGRRGPAVFDVSFDSVSRVHRVA